MGKLINLAIYNPAILDDQEFLDGFVARQELTKRLLNRLGEVTPKNIARHLLLIGQRGMGKTSMLRRLALGIEQNTELSSVLLPLSFREEQYNVHHLGVFWCNCLDALGDYLEKTGRTEEAAELDSEVGHLSVQRNDPDGTAACAMFKEWCARKARRPLLLIDNIDLIFNGLKEEQQWGLRRILQEKGGVVVVGASATLMEDTVKVEAPFYDFFQVHQLAKLEHTEMVSCLRQIALKREEQGKQVIRILDTDSGRIHTLYDLTGGNPRTLVLLYLLLELDAEGDVMDDLERLLDQVTVLYKARVEDLAPQTRVVLDAVALAWNPVTAASVAAETGLPSTTITSQFDRLIKMGLLEKVSLSTPAPVGYQLGERFFNIWYLMRNASRRQRNRLRWLTEFLRRLYSPQQLADLADDFIRRSKERGCCSGLYGMALAEALDDSSQRHILNHQITRLFFDQAEKMQKQLDGVIDRSDLDQTTLSMAEMQQRVFNCHRDWGETTAQEFWDLLGSSLVLTVEDKARIVEAVDTVPLAKVTALMEYLRNELLTLEQAVGLPGTLGILRRAVQNGIVTGRNDVAHAMAAVRMYNAPELALLMVMLSDTCEMFLTAEQFKPLHDAISNLLATTNYTSWSYASWGDFLAVNGHSKEAEAAYRKSIELSPRSLTWNNLGNLLKDHLGRYDEAEASYRKAIEIDPTKTLLWSNLGKLFHYHLDRYDEAEVSYRKAIEIDPENDIPWLNLGSLLHYRLERYDEAETAYYKAIELDPTDALPWVNLGNLLQQRLNRYEEAEAAYRKAIELDSQDARVWNCLGQLLADHLHRYNEAEQAYHTALELDPSDIYPQGNLAYLLLVQPAKSEEAETMYTEALTRLPEHGKQLLSAFHALVHENLGKARDHLAQALEENHPELYSVYYEDLLRVLRQAKQRGYGERLLTFLDESGLGERHWPLRAAFEAYLQGEAKLRDVNPEVRGAAKRIFDWLNSSTTPQDNGTVKKKRSTKKR